jgi:hypothetical protein
MVSDEQLKSWRALGVKTIKVVGPTFPEPGLIEVEFFPRSLLDVTEFDDTSDPKEAATEPPPAPDDETAVVKVPAAMARVLTRGSVS